MVDVRVVVVDGRVVVVDGRVVVVEGRVVIVDGRVVVVDGRVVVVIDGRLVEVEGRTVPDGRCTWVSRLGRLLVGVPWYCVPGWRCVYEVPGCTVVPGRVPWLVPDMPGRVFMPEPGRVPPPAPLTTPGLRCEPVPGRVLCAQPWLTLLPGRGVLGRQ